MAKKFKKMLAMMLTLVMVVSSISITAFAEPDRTVDSEQLGKKSAELLDRENNRYEVKIEVPGKDGDNRHDEVILMVDGSYSLDQEWPEMKKAINKIGETVLDGKGVTQLTLMAFGMGDNEVLVHAKTADELAAALGELPGNLLYGRSSTNCEAGFTGVAEYIANHDDTLKDAHVIYISDGRINTDETPRAFDANWKTWATKFGALTVAYSAFEEPFYYAENLPEAFKTVFGNRFDGLTKDEILTKAFEEGAVTEEEFYAYTEQIWTDVYAYSGLTRGNEYPVSDVERAFVKYDKEKGTYIQDAFYYTTYKSSYVTYPNATARTKAAAEELAAMDKVKSMYVVDYDAYSSWMDTGITNEKSTFVQSNGIADLCNALTEALVNLSKTPFNDVVVTDYMSKWVNYDANLKIIDDNSGETIWTEADGWLIDEGRPTAKETPVKVELVDAADYVNGGNDVVGNTSGDIYKLTWYVKDGALLRSDNYTLTYEVTVDTEEDGFVYFTDYPANGNTDLTYKDENDEEHTNPIKVPDVNAETAITTLQVKKTNENGEVLTGAEFELFAVNGAEKTFMGTYAVDTNGELAIERMLPGNYQLVEVVAPSGFLVPAEAIDISIDDDLNITVTETKTAYVDENGVIVVVNRPPHTAVVLTIDMSGTMYRNKMDGKRYVEVAKEKAIEFTKQYAESTTEPTEKRLLAVVCFDTDATVKQQWIDVSTAEGLSTAVSTIKALKVADNGKASSNQVCTNFDAGVILSRNLLKQDVVSEIDRCFTIILSDGAPTVTVNADTDTVGTIKSSFWGNQLDANGKKYQNARCGGGWTHPAEVSKTLTYMATGENNLADLTYNYTINGEEKEGIFIVGVGGLMNFKLFYDAVYGTSNGTRTSDVKKKPAAFNNVDALSDYSQAEIMKLTTGDWMEILAEEVGGTYESATNTVALQEEFANIMTAIKDTTTPAK